jgi:hypothetical protein
MRQEHERFENITNEFTSVEFDGDRTVVRFVRVSEKEGRQKPKGTSSTRRANGRFACRRRAGLPG